MDFRNRKQTGAVLWAALFSVSIDVPGYSVDLCKVTVVPVDEIRVVAVAEFNANGVPMYLATRPMVDPDRAKDQAQDRCQSVRRQYRREAP